ncbi:hypothetical protein ACFLS1_03135 [Verrucomicrobiota bacterium]
MFFTFIIQRSSFSILLCLFLFTTGCAVSGLDTARRDFYKGNYEQAYSCLTNAPPDKTHKVLLLMERGTIHQARNKHDESIEDWLTAARLAEQLDYYSVTRGVASFAVNDQVMAFRGVPYERTLLHAFTAKSYLALSMWEDAAVEARNIIFRLENLNGFPDDPYSHYLAGFCLETIGDYDGAAFQYRTASELHKDLSIDENTGRIIPNSDTNSLFIIHNSSFSSELVCFVSMGRSPIEYGVQKKNYSAEKMPYAEIYSDNNYLGRSYLFTITKKLRSETEKRLEALRVTKESTRILLKEALVEAIENKNEELGKLIRLILFSVEIPDKRRWETLPLGLQIARVPCPENLKNYKIIFKNSWGQVISEKTISAPLSKSRKVFVSFCRDL